MKMEDLDKVFSEWHYILVGRMAVKANGFKEWSEWFCHANRTISVTRRNGIAVSTIFLGINHGCNTEDPILFETMIFGGERNQYIRRYTTWNDAAKGHCEICELAFADLQKDKKNDNVKPSIQQ